MDQKKSFDEEDFFDEDDFDLDVYPSYRDRIEKIFQKNKINSKERIEKIKKQNEKKKKIKEFFTGNFSKIKIGIKTFFIKIADPSLIVAIMTTYFIIKSNRGLQEKLDNQQQQIVQIERQYNVENENSFSLKKMLKENWPQIVVTTGTMLIPVSKHVYNHLQVKQQLNVANRTLDQSKVELNQAQEQLTNTKIELVKVKEDSEKKIDTIKETHTSHINRLHRTLNWFNDAAMKSAERESEMRNEIVKVRWQLSDTIKQRDEAEENVKSYQGLLSDQDKKIEQEKYQVELLTANLNDIQKEKARITVELNKEKNSNKILNINLVKLNKKYREQEKKSSDLASQLSEKKMIICKEQVYHKKLEEDLKSHEFQKLIAEKDAQKLRVANDKNEYLLQKAAQETDRYAIKMDDAQKKLDQYHQKDMERAKQINDLTTDLSKKDQKLDIQNKELERKNEVLINIQKELIAKDQKNQDLEEIVYHLNDKQNTYIIEQDRLNKELEANKAAFKVASVKDKSIFEVKIKQIEQQVKSLKKERSKLERTLSNKDKELLDSTIEREQLAGRLIKMEKQFEVQKEGYHTRLAVEREEQEKKFNILGDNTNQLINKILDQQEADQKKPWWQKIILNISPSVNWVGTDKDNTTTEERTKESYFFGAGYPDIPSSMKVKEKYIKETDEWKVVPKEVEEKSDNFATKAFKYYYGNF